MNLKIFNLFYIYNVYIATDKRKNKKNLRFFKKTLDKVIIVDYNNSNHY